MYIAIGVAAFFALMFLLANRLKGHESCSPEEEWDGTTEIEVSYQVNDDEPVTFKDWYRKK